MRVALSCVVLFATAGAALAGKPTRFWNLTDNTITSFELAPTGTDAFGPEQINNDHDKSVDHDERLPIVGIASGTYDARFADAKGRKCTAKNIAVQEGKVFTIEEKQALCKP